MIAAKIVETFFDCAYNPFVNKYLNYKFELKKALSDSLSKNDMIINAFAELIKQGTIDLKKMKFIKKEMQKHFAPISHTASDIINKLSDEDLLKMIGEFEEITKKGSEKKWISLVRPILFGHSSCLDKICSIYSESGYIYIDQLSCFEDVLGELNNIFNIKSSFKNIIQISMVDSKDEPLIQAADLLSGFISRSFVEKISSNDKKIKELWKKLICIRDIFSEKAKTIVWEFYAREDFVNLISDLVDGNPTEINSPESVIKEQINKAVK